MSKTLEPLTEREQAILSGNDPDAIVPKDVEEVAESVEEQEEVLADTEVEAGDEPVEGGTEAAEREPETSWIDDSARQAAQDYGISEEELSSFGSADEFRRAQILLDRNLAKPPGQNVQEEEEEAEDEPQGLDLEYYKQNYDEHVVKLVERVQAQDKSLKETQEFIQNYQAQQEQLAYQRHIETFHALADQLDKDRYGSTQDGSAMAKDDNRRKLYEAAETLKAGLEARNQKVPSYAELLKRAEHVAFGADLLKQKQEQVRAQLAEQSKRRRPVAGSRPTRAQTKTRADIDPIEAIVNDPKVVAFWNKAQEDNGSE